MFNNYVKDPNHMSAETASASIAAAQAASTGRPMSGKKKIDYLLALSLFPHTHN